MIVSAMPKLKGMHENTKPILQGKRGVLLRFYTKGLEEE